MSRARTIITIPILILSAASFAQDQASTPKTKLEAFQSRTGIVLIRGYSTVGSLGLGGQLVVDAREFRDGSDPNSPRAAGISITIRDPGAQAGNTSYIDVDEIDSLLSGIDYISKVSKDVTKLDQFEVEYRTKGDLRITVFNSPTGKLSAAVSSGTIGRKTAFIEMPELTKLRDLIEAAKSKL